MKVAILGFGTVGKGVFEIIKNSKDFENSYVLDLPEKITEDFQTDNIETILNNKSIETVVECIGGTNIAYCHVKRCLESRKNVVTSNKALVAKYGKELEELARKNNVSFLFSAACGGAIPILHNISIASQTDTINRAGGILNGTTNFILSKMQDENKDYSECLTEAQKLGYAEFDPTADVSGLDTLRKVMLLCAVSFGKLPSKGCFYEGIENFSSKIAEDLKARGRVLRLMGQTGKTDKGYYAYVEPVAVKSSEIEASISSNINFAYYEAENSTRITLSGPGAGRFPTASAILRDLTSVKDNVKSMLLKGIEEIEADNSSVLHSYYIVADGKTEIKENVSVLQMHKFAEELRERGGKVFFAEYRK